MTRMYGLILASLGLIAATVTGAGSAAEPYELRPPYDHLMQFEVKARLVESSAYVRVSSARSQFGVDGSGLTAAVLDTGLRTTHVDFTGKIAARRNFTTDDSSNPNAVDDGNGHGTNVAGIICADGLNVGFAPGARVVPLKVLDNGGGGYFSWSASALDWVIANAGTYDITVVNMSLGDGSNLTSEPFGDPVGLRSRIQTLRNMRIPVVIAAGNDFFSWDSEEGMGYPGIIRECVSVGAIYDANIGPIYYGSGAIAYSTDAGRITPFSQRLHSSTNSATRTDIFCTGAALTSSGNLSDIAYSTMHGTSQAAPCVAGLILLAQEFYQRETGELPTVDDLERWLRMSSKTNLDGDDEDDNVTNTQQTYIQADAVDLLTAINEELGGSDPCTCPLNCPGGSVASMLKLVQLPLPFSQLLTSVRSFRDGVLNQSPEGRRLVAAYYDHALEISARLLRDPALTRDLLACLADIQPALAEATATGATSLTPQQWDQGWNLIDRLQANASTGLTLELDVLKSWLRTHRLSQDQHLVRLRFHESQLPVATVEKQTTTSPALMFVGLSSLLVAGSAWSLRRRCR